MPHKNPAAFLFSEMDLNNEVILYDNSKNDWLYFRNPVEIVTARTLSDVKGKLERIEKLTQSDGFHAAGFISYEAAPAFDDALRAKPEHRFPLLWFGIYKEPVQVTLPQDEIEDVESESEWTPSVSQTDYNHAIERIKQYIAAGDTYQVNYTLRLRKEVKDNGWRLFRNLVQSQRGGYSAYINTGDYVICSASPEQFFALDGDRITTRPMKGTAPRGRFSNEDRERSDWLKQSPKNRAENLMIVDMIRNDLGRVARTGSVRVERLFNIEKYPTVWQMTSTVTAKSDSSITDIITALFPCASITGAPKASTMKIISDLESTSREIYTGSIGYIGPNRKAQFNVAIRTVLIERKKQIAEYGVGGGIVWDSGIADEYEECKLKAKVLFEKRSPFSLLETMLWTPKEGYILLNEHMCRLSDSASYFDYRIDTELIHKRLNEAISDSSKRPYKVRLFLDQNGNVTVEKEPLDTHQSTGIVKMSMGAEPVNSDNIFLYHKTTNRNVYVKARSTCRQTCDDVLLWNERGEITETTIANVVIQIDGELYTPPVTCGLLPGTFRNYLIRQGKIEEKIITPAMLEECEKLFLVNSVRLWREAEIMEYIKLS